MLEVYISNFDESGNNNLEISQTLANDLYILCVSSMEIVPQLQTEKW